MDTRDEASCNKRQRAQKRVDDLRGSPIDPHHPTNIDTKCAKRINEKAKEKYREMFEIQKSGDKTSSGEIGLDIRTHASPKVGHDQVSGGVSVLCWHAAPVAYVL